MLDIGSKRQVKLNLLNKEKEQFYSRRQAVARLIAEREEAGWGRWLKRSISEDVAEIFHETQFKSSYVNRSCFIRQREKVY